MAGGAAGITAASSAGNVKGAAGLMKDVIIEMAKYDAIEKLKKSGIIEKTVQAIQSIADASKVQASSLQQIDVGIGQISSVVQANSGTAHQSASASQSLAGQAQLLRELVDNFKLVEEANIR